MSRTSLLRRALLGSSLPFAFAGALAIAVVPHAALGALPPANAMDGTTDPQVLHLLHDAATAMRQGHVELAILQLKNAVVLEPHNGAARAHLGLAMLAHGDAQNAEVELHHAKDDGAPLPLVVPPLLQIMLTRNEMKSLLEQFADPGQGANDQLSADILRARGIAFLSFGQIPDAKSAMDRSLAINRSIGGLLGRAEIARTENDNAMSDKLIDEAMSQKPNDVHVLLVKAESLRHRDNAKALDFANKIIALSPNDISGKIERILILYDLNQKPKAVAELNAILAKTPMMPLAIYYKAVFFANDHQTRNAWLTAEALPQEFVLADASIATNVAAIAAASGNLEPAGATLAALLNLHPENVNARLRLAAIRIQQNSYELAAQVLFPLIEDKNPQALALMAEASFKQGHYADTLDYLQRSNLGGNNNVFLQKDIAIAEMRSGKTDQGIEDLEKVAQKDPARVEFSGPLIAALIKNKRFDDAQKAIDRFAAAQPKSPFVGLYRAQVDLAKNNYQGAMAAFSDSLKVAPKFLPALFFRALAETDAGQVQPAMQDLDRVLAVDPANMPALVQKAFLLTQKGQYGPATDTLQQAIAKNPSKPLPRLALTNLQMMRKQYDDAARTAAAWLQAIPSDPDAMAHLGEIQLLNGQKKEAIGTYGALADKLPQSALAQVLYAQALALGGDSSGANAAAMRAIKLAPDSLTMHKGVVALAMRYHDSDLAITAAKDYQSVHPGLDADLLLADTYAQLHRFDDAKATLQARLAQGSDDNAVVLLSQIHAAQGDNKGALAILDQALQKKGDDVGLHRARASLMLKSGDSLGARNEYEVVLQKQPNDPQSLNDLAWIIQDQDPTKALALATKAVQAAPASGEIADTLGWLMYRHGDAKGASNVLARAHSDSKANGEIAYHFAVVLNALGKRPEAKAVLQSALDGQAFDDALAARKLIGQW